MNKISPRVQSIELSGIRRFNELANTVDNVIKLTIGELDIKTPTKIKDAAIKAINENKTTYTTNKGIAKLRGKIASKYNYSPKEVILTVGTTEGLATVIKSVINEGDEVIIPTPGYVGYKPLITLEGGVVKELDTTYSNFKITKELLSSSVTNHTKALLITSPNNPTGVVLSKEETNIIKDFVLKHDLILISDEIYHDISFVKAYSFAIYPSLKNNLVVLSGFSKSHAMTGFRIGYIVSKQPWIDEFVKVHQYNVTSTSTISQYAALEAIDIDNKEIVDTLKKRRNLVINTFNKLEIPYVEPSGAFYLFYNIDSYNMSSVSYCEKLLHEYKIALIPGEYFLGNHTNYVRLSYAVNDDLLKKALHQIEVFHTSQN